MERATLIAWIIRIKDDLLLKYTSAWGRRTLCKSQPPLEECDTLILGSITRSFKSSKSATEFQRMSILGLRDEISRFRLNFFPKFRCPEMFCQSAPPSYSASTSQCPCGSRVLAQGSHSKTCDPMPAILSHIDSIVKSVPGMDLKALGRIPMKAPKWGAADTR